MNENFYIENLGNRGLWVVILSSESTSTYWTELEDVIHKNHWSDMDIHFDFLYRNGFRNRFYKTRIGTESEIVCQLHKCSCKCAFVTDRFFSLNAQLLEGSVLSNLQRKMYLSHLKIR